MASNLQSYLAQIPDTEFDRLAEFVSALNGLMLGAPKMKVVRVRGARYDYKRLAPGAKKLFDRVGKDAFDGFAALIGVAIEAQNVIANSSYGLSEKFGRTSIALGLGTIGALGPVGSIISLAISGACIVWPEQMDRIKGYFFKSNPVTNFLSDQIIKLGGKTFQNWASKPSIIDYL